MICAGFAEGGKDDYTFASGGPLACGGLLASCPGDVGTTVVALTTPGFTLKCHISQPGLRITLNKCSAPASSFGEFVKQ